MCAIRKGCIHLSVIVSFIYFVSVFVCNGVTQWCCQEGQCYVSHKAKHKRKCCVQQFSMLNGWCLGEDEKLVTRKNLKNYCWWSMKTIWRIVCFNWAEHALPTSLKQTVGNSCKDKHFSKVLKGIRTCIFNMSTHISICLINRNLCQLTYCTCH